MKNNILTAAVVLLLIGAIYWLFSSSSKKYDADLKDAGVEKIGPRSSSVYEIEFDGQHYIVVETFRGIGITKK